MAWAEGRMRGLTSAPGHVYSGSENGRIVPCGRGMGVPAVLEGFVDASALLKPGIYALVKDGAIVYIGQAKRPLTRIEAHRSLWGRKSAPGWLPIKAILFDQVFVLPCRVEDLDRLERALVDLYRPKFNVKLKPPTHVPTSVDIGLMFPAGPKLPPIVRRF